jgi:hypothetical protein
MGWFFRKGFSFGPFRINFSKSGVGGSVGVKGARAGVNARGNKYLSLFRHGIGYRKEYGDSEAGERRSRKRRDDAMGWLPTIFLLGFGFAAGLLVGILYGPNLKSQLNTVIQPTPAVTATPLPTKRGR